MQAAIRRMGNSAGILLPKTVLAHLDVATGDMLDLNFDEGRVVLSPARTHPRAGWADAARALADVGGDDDGAVWPAFGNKDDEALAW